MLFFTAYVVLNIVTMPCTMASQSHESHESHQSHPAQHGAASARKTAELGTSAAVDQQGNLWVVSKEVADNGNSFIALRSSRDAGKTWSAPRHVIQEPVAARGEERPKIAFGPVGELYVLYTRPRAHAKNPHIGDIRLTTSTDGGKTFSQPITVHANRDVTVHAFGSMVVDKQGNIYVAWIDGRDREAARTRHEPYPGSALYYAVSHDDGKTFNGDFKIADHTCECCRISLSLTPQGHPVVMWRHIFAPDIRDHAMAELARDGKPGKLERVTFDGWRADACPHHGPSVVYTPDGTRHQVWFNGMEGDAGGVRYGMFHPHQKTVKPVSIGSTLASHADVAVQGNRVVIVWKQFDGKSTAILGKISGDGGASWSEREIARTSGDSDKPYLVNTPSGISLLWHTGNEGIRIIHTAQESS